MTIEVGTSRQVLRRIAVATAISIALSVAIGFLAMAYIYGTDMNAAIPVSLAFKLGLGMGVVAPALICPILAFRTIRAIQERDRAHVELRRIAETDQLTGLLNRRGFDAAAQAATEQCARHNRPVSALIVDVDFFKAINDSFGHEFGDAALVHVAAMLNDAATAEAFIVGRQGGEEFVALLPGWTGQQAATIAEKLRQTCAETPFAFKGKSALVAVSIGVTTATRRVSLPQLMEEADSALYRAKRSGRNRVTLHRPAIELEQAA